MKLSNVIVSLVLKSARPRGSGDPVSLGLPLSREWAKRRATQYREREFALPKLGREG